MMHSTPRTVAYLRVSTQDQDVEKNKADILMLANCRDLAKSILSKKRSRVRVSWRQRQIARILDDLQAVTGLSSVSFPAWVAACWSVWNPVVAAQERDRSVCR